MRYRKWPKFKDFGRVVPVGHLHSSTLPAAIAADQRAAVARAIRRVGADPAAVSAEAILPVSVVVRRVKELRTIPAAARTKG